MTVIKEVLESIRSVAVVGVSDKPDRASHAVVKYLIEHTDWTVYMVNPLISHTLDRPVYASLKDLPEVPDCVDVFRRVEDAEPVLDDAIALGAKVFWLQLGLSSEELKAKAEAAGLTVVMDACLKVEHEIYA